jgi:hypothetical protein
MAGNIDELKEYFAIKTTPPPFPGKPKKYTIT